MALLLASPVTSAAMAMEVGAGFAAVEEGDDRLRPGVLAHVGFQNDYAGRLYFYGREFGPVREETFLVSAVRRWGLFKQKALQASFGLAVMDERTTVSYEASGDRPYDKAEDNFNVGATFGVSWTLPKGPLYLATSWDSHVFPAGLGGLLLASGRKQTISLAMGVTLK